MQSQRNTSVMPPTIHAQYQRHALAERALTRDALDQLGRPMPAARSLLEAREPGVVGVRVGTDVFVERGGKPWIVVAAAGRDLDLARRTPEGVIERTTTPFANAARFSAELLREPRTVDGRRGADLLTDPDPAEPPRLWEVSEGSLDRVSMDGRDAVVTMLDHGDVERFFKDEGDASTLPRSFHTRWDDVMKTHGADTVRPVATPPAGWEHVASLRELVGDTRLVASSLGTPYGRATRLIGTDSRPGAAAPILRDAASMQDWFASSAGLDVWAGGRPLLLRTDVRRYLGNASAGMVGEVATTTEGPRDVRIRETWLRATEGTKGQQLRKTNGLLREHDLAVRTHEAGHIAHTRAWGEGESTQASRLAIAEAGVVEEAYPDLFGAARAQRPSIGVRELGRLQYGYATLDRLRADGRRTGNIEPHTGTQLVTKPMVGFADQHGWDAVAEISGAATRAIGRDLAEGTIDSVDIPRAASALHEAAAWRLGADAPAVRALREGWRQLGVPLRALF